MKFKFAILFIFLISIGNANAQSLNYMKKVYSWGTTMPQKIEVDPIFAGGDAVILEESCVYNISGNRVPAYGHYTSAGNYLNYVESSNGRSPVVHKHLRIKFLTEEGIKKYSTIVLPESFDRQSDLLVVPHDKRNIIRRPRGEFQCVDSFGARIIRKDGTLKEIVMNESTETEVRPRTTKEETYFSWIFKVENLEPGDELEVDYVFEGSFNSYEASKIFLNGDLPKQNVSFILRERIKDKNMVFGHNGIQASDTIYSKEGGTEYRDYIFKATNLKGGIGECGARPIMELPYISFYRHSFDFGERENNSAVLTKALPYPWWYFLSKFLSYRYDNLTDKLSRTDNTTASINRFFNAEKSKLNKPNSLELFSSIQHSLNEDFSYEKNEDFVDGTDNRLEKLGKYVESKTLRYVSRNRLYEELFLRMDTDYFISFIPDKRTDVLDPTHFEIIGKSSLFFSFKMNKGFNFCYPKGGRFGYEIGEFPFYFEGSTTALIPQHLPSVMRMDLMPDVEYPFIRVPANNKKDNLRNTMMLINMSLDSLNLRVTGKLNLSGQFSTLTRGYYLYGDKDSTVNTSYYNSVLDLADKNEKVHLTKGVINQEYPFNAGFKFEFTKNNFITKENENTFSFQLNGWFNNILDLDFSARNRQQAYYSDFQYEDVHNFMIRFDHPIKLSETEIMTDTVSNGFSYYVCKVEQKDERSISIVTAMVIHTDRVPADKAKDIEDTFNAVKSWNARRITIKKL